VRVAEHLNLHVSGKWRAALDGSRREIRCPADGQLLATAADMPGLRSYLSVFRCSYGCSSQYSDSTMPTPFDDIVANDTAILGALRLGNPELVTALWSRKVDNAVFNLVEQFRRLGVSETQLRVA
jgi:hypothetical protein